jgi:hypothetical protein
MEMKSILRRRRLDASRRPNAMGFATCAAAIFAYASLSAHAAGERLLGTGGVMDIEGTGGGGLTPWAMISGLGTDRELGASA